MNESLNLEPKERFFDHGGGLKLHYWERGEPKEETFVSVHGVRDQGRSWDSFIAPMIARGLSLQHAVALDLRGHGDSEWPNTSRGYQPEDFLADLAGLLRHLDKSPSTTIGHSLGGSMALLHAGAFPEVDIEPSRGEDLQLLAKKVMEQPPEVIERIKKLFVQ